LAPGVPKRLDAFVTRITAPNPGAMTGPGTNSYLVGTDALALIDPGPPIESHIAALLATRAALHPRVVSPPPPPHPLARGTSHSGSDRCQADRPPAATGARTGLHLRS